MIRDTWILDALGSRLLSLDLLSHQAHAYTYASRRAARCGEVTFAGDVASKHASGRYVGWQKGHQGYPTRRIRDPTSLLQRLPDVP